MSYNLADKNGDSGTDNGGDEHELVSRQDMFEVLSNERRRCVLRYLADGAGEQVELSEIVEFVAACENGKEVPEIDYTERKRVYTALRQTHLPKLDDAGVIEYDTRRGTLETTNDAERVRLYLDYVPRNEIPWGTYYLGLSGIAAVTYLLIATGFLSIGYLSLSTVMWFFLAAFGVSSIVHTYRTRRSKLDSGRPRVHGE